MYHAVDFIVRQCAKKAMKEILNFTMFNRQKIQIQQLKKWRFL